MRTVYFNEVLLYQCYDFSELLTLDATTGVSECVFLLSV